MAVPGTAHHVANSLGAVRHQRPVLAAARRPPTVSVVIPTLNEAENVRFVLERIPEWVTQVVVVDGHSVDGTIDVVRSCYPQALILEQEGKGKGDALITGFRACTEDIIVTLDADGSTDPAEIPRFVVALNTGGDFAKGSRFVTGGGSDDLTVLRRWGNRGLRLVVNGLWRSRYSDLCYGYNAFWRRCLPDLRVDCSGFEVETLMSIRALNANLNVVEVPSHESRRLQGSSNLSTWRDGWRVLRTIVAERIRPG